MVVAAASNHGRLLAAADDADRLATDRNRREKRLPERRAPAFPAALPNVVAVGALNGDSPADFNPVVRTGENRGAEELAPWIDVLAPGVDTVGAYFGDESAPELIKVPVLPKNGQVATEEELKPKEFKGAARWTGTSFAAATVTGAVAGRTRPGTSPREALDDLLDDNDCAIRRAHT
jgi:hypothetical protein